MKWPIVAMLALLSSCSECERADLRTELCGTWTCAEPEHPVLVSLYKRPDICVCVPPEEIGQ